MFSPVPQTDSPRGAHFQPKAPVSVQLMMFFAVFVKTLRSSGFRLLKEGQTHFSGFQEP